MKVCITRANFHGDFFFCGFRYAAHSEENGSSGLALQVVVAGVGGDDVGGGEL
jgi:hypothetical protein